MNNNQLNFDSTTGQPINQNINNLSNTGYPNNNMAQNPSISSTQQIQTVPIIPTNNVIQPNALNTQQQMQSIPTVEQPKQEFMNNTQTINDLKKDEKKDSPNIVFIIILFAIIFLAIFFLFPYLMKVIG